MKRLKIGLLTLLSCLALISCIALAACKDNTKAETFTIGWTPDEHVTIVAEGYDTLPTELEKGTEVVFTVTPDNGYEITSVAPASLSKDGDKYKFTVDKNINITVKSAKGIESVTATLKDADKVYYAGDTIEASDINVSVKYKTNETETVTSGYTVKYGTGDGEALAIGDSALTVTYRGVATQIDLPLLDGEEGVVALVTIDTDGGSLTQAYLDKISSFGHYSYDATKGVATFTHKGLTDAVALPVLGTEVTKGLEGDYIYRGWNGSETTTSIPKNTVVSVSYKLSTTPVLLNLTKIYYTAEQEVPYLVIEGDFKLATSAYLFLYEGNDKAELVGPTLTNEDPANRHFVLKFDMLKVVEKEYKGKWMDIKFVTVIKEATETEPAETLTQEIMLEDYADIADFCNLKQVINVGAYDYGFKTYESNGHTYLKAVYEDAAVYSFTLEAGTVTEGEGEEAVTLPALVIKGQISAAQLEKYKGKAVKIDFNNGAWTAAIDQEGAWTLTIPLRVEGDRAIAYGTDGYAHFSIIEAVDNETQLYKDGNDGNFLNKCCAGGLSALEDRSSLSSVLTGDAIRIANDDNSQVFYIGEGRWGGLVATSRNEKKMIVSTTGTKLEAGKVGEEDVAFLVFTGNWKYFVDHTYNEEADLEALMAEFTEYSVQNDAGWAYLNGASDNNKKAENTVFVIHENGTFEVKIALNGADNGSYWYLHYCHTGKSNGDLSRSYLQTIDETTVTVGGQTFSFFDSTDAAPEGHQSWLKGRLIVYVAAAE